MGVLVTYVQVTSKPQVPTIQSQASLSHSTHTTKSSHFKQVKSSHVKGQVKSKSSYNTKQKKVDLFIFSLRNDYLFYTFIL